MAPVVHNTSDAAPQGTGTTLELSLITVSLAVTIIVQVAHTKLPVKGFPYSRTANKRFAGFALYSLSVSIFAASLVLGWQRRITLEALVAIIFALAPTFVRLSSALIFVRRVLRLVLDAYRLGFSQKNLAYDDDLFYLRIETPCQTTAVNGDAHPVAKCANKNCNAQIYCVYRADKRSPSFISAIAMMVCRNLFCIRPQKNATIRIPLHTRREGNYQRYRATLEADIIDHGKHTIDIRPTVEEPRSQGLNPDQLLSALLLAHEPRKVFLKTKNHVFAVLSMIAEIFMIGDLVYFVRGKYLNDELQKIVLEQQAPNWTLLKGRSMLVHKRVIEQLQLMDWMPENFEHFTADGAPHKENQSRLFYVLLEKSGLWYERHSRDKNDGATCIVKDIKDCELEVNKFEEFLYNRVDQWLVSWGCSEDELQNSERSTLSWPSVSSAAQSSSSSA